MSGGRSPRQKGNRAERALVTFLQSRGFAAELRTQGTRCVYGYWSAP